MGYIIDVTDKTFDTVVVNNKLVLVDYWAEHCTACINIINPMLQQISEDEDIVICKYNVDENTEYAKHIRSLPTLVLYRYGVPLDTIVGAVGKHKILDMIRGR